jgi:hypothetical protein
VPNLIATFNPIGLLNVDYSGTQITPGQALSNETTAAFPTLSFTPGSDVNATDLATMVSRIFRTVELYSTPRTCLPLLPLLPLSTSSWLYPSTSIRTDQPLINSNSLSVSLTPTLSAPTKLAPLNTDTGLSTVRPCLVMPLLMPLHTPALPLCELVFAVTETN